MQQTSIAHPDDRSRGLVGWLRALIDGLAGRPCVVASGSGAAESDLERVDDLRAAAEARYSFHMEPRRLGCVMVHGLSSTPQSVRPVATYMAEHGIEVEAVLLPGHGTSPEDLETTSWMDWYDAVRAAVRRLRPRVDVLFVCGQSMGGALALRAAAHEPVDGVIGLSAFVFLRDWRLRFLPVIRRLRRWQPCIGNDIADPEARDEVCYDRMSFGTIDQLLLLGRTVKEDLAQIEVPALIMQSRVDHVVPPDNADYIYDHLASQDKELVRVENSYHVISMDYDRLFVAERCVRFMRRIGFAESRRSR